ncbi:MAG: hypothetical protein ACT4OZ_06245 [Gemmatimonadota bacterium]
MPRSQIPGSVPPIGALLHRFFGFAAVALVTATALTPPVASGQADRQTRDSARMDTGGRWLGAVHFPPRFTPLDIGTDFVAGLCRMKMESNTYTSIGCTDEPVSACCSESSSPGGAARYEALREWVIPVTAAMNH